MFQAWFAVYPKKVDPDDALRVFTRVVKSKKVTFEQLLAGARRYAMETQAERTERRFIKAPAVWLNKGSWKNEAGAQATDKQPSLAPRAATGIAGIMSRITEEDFNDGNR
jgi:hypothetical protein